MKNYILLAVAILAGILAFVLSKAQIESRYAQLKKTYQTILVVAPLRNMIKGDEIKPGDLGAREIFRQDLVSSMVRAENVTIVNGHKLAADVPKQSPLHWYHIVMPAQGAGGSPLARIIREKERALSISVDSNSAVSGLLQPNDHVDVIATFRFPPAEGQTAPDTVTVTLLQNVTLVAVGQSLPASGYEGDEPQGRGRGGFANVTVAVTPKEAEMLVFSEQKGKLTLTLRNPGDPYVEQDIQDVNWQFLRDHLKKYMEEREIRLKP